jgi:pimeloyl-ACP methyl ester carboxylesterase
MVGSTARRIARWAGKALLWLAAAALLLAVVGAVCQAVATRRAEGAYPPPGKLVGVGDHKLLIHCAGEGGPTVVLEAASGATSAQWVRVQQQVSETTRVCAYDRAGMGWSESGPEPRDADRVAGELHALLGGAGVEGPYVLAGHSYGGLYAQAYAARYPDKVAGVTLVESSHPEQFGRLPEARESYEKTRRLFAVAPLLARIGVVRMFGLSPAPPDLPERQRAQIGALVPSTRQVAATAEEFRATPRSTAQARGLGGLGGRPLAVVSAGTQPRDWLGLQDELTALSSDGVHRVVDGATHVSVLHDQGDAKITGAAIVGVVEAARDDRPLARQARQVQATGKEERPWAPPR